MLQLATGGLLIPTLPTCITTTGPHTPVTESDNSQRSRVQGHPLLHLVTLDR